MADFDQQAFLAAVRDGFRAALRRDYPDSEWDIVSIPAHLEGEEAEEYFRVHAARDRVARGVGVEN